MNSTQMEHLLSLAEKAAREAGRRLRERSDSWTSIVVQKGKDIKLGGDRLAEDLILEILTGGSDFPILSEERGWVGAPNDGLIWIIDPLDGSANYAQGIPLCAVSIALVDGTQPKLGVIYDFNRDELYLGIAGGSASLNGAAMRVSSVTEQSRGVFMTGLPARHDFSDDSLHALVSDMALWRKVRMIGTASLAIAYVASGKADLYREENIMFWDVAAGCALVLAAGGAIEVTQGPLDEPKAVAAHNGLLHMR